MNNIERRIQEQRTIQAIQKNLMGFGGKFALVAKILGCSIQDHGINLYDETEFFSVPPSFDDVDEEIPTLDMDAGSISLGYTFDGLSRGIHLEIILMKADNKITVTRKGYKVYEEENGKLLAYAPSQEWESIIDKLYKEAQNKAKQQGVFVQMEKEIQEMQMKEGFLERLRKRWGI